VLGANDTNTDADNNAINAEAEAIADEFHRLMDTSTYKGKDVFVSSANSDYVSMGGRNSEMTFGIGEVQYSNLYLHDHATFYDEQETAIIAALGGGTGAGTNDHTAITDNDDKIFNAKKYLAELASNGFVSSGTNYTASGQAVLIEGADYELITSLAGTGGGTPNTSDADYAKFITTASGVDHADMDAADGSDAATDGADGAKFTAAASGQAESAAHFAKQVGQLVFAASEGMYHTVDADGEPDTTGQANTDLLTAQIEIVQARINTARVEAGSQYAALESAVNYTTDLTAQYELGYNTVNDVNFSMETAHLAKNQILQQAATAMLAQANQGQQGLLQLIS
jgi:flagellin